MTDFVTDGFFPIRLPRDDVLALFERLDHAVKAGAATLVLDRLGFWGIRVHDHRAVGFSDDDWGRTEQLVLEADEVLVYVLDPTPDELIREWASQYDDALVDTAVERVNEIRTAMPITTRLWGAKNASPIAGLGEINFEVAKSVGLSTWYANLNITGLLPPRLGEDPESQHLNLRLFPSDITYLRSLCDAILLRMASAQRGG